MMRRWALLGCAALLCAPALPARAQSEAADAAVTRIRAFYDALLSVMKQGDKLGIRGRYDKLAPTVRSTFDLAAMTRIAVGPEWNSIPPEQQAALIENFSQMTIATYANRFDSYSGERFEVDALLRRRSSTGHALRRVALPQTSASIASVTKGRRPRRYFGGAFAGIPGSSSSGRPSFEPLASRSCACRRCCVRLFI